MVSARALPQHPPSHPCDCRPGRLRQTQPDAPAPSSKLRQLLATGGSPAEYTQTRLRTQIVFFRHSRLQNLRQGRCVFLRWGTPQYCASNTRHARLKSSATISPAACHFSGRAGSISYPLAEQISSRTDWKSAPLLELNAPGHSPQTIYLDICHRLHTSFLLRSGRLHRKGWSGSRPDLPPARDAHVLARAAEGDDVHRLNLPTVHPGDITIMLA